MTARITALAPPFSIEDQAIFDRIMPPDVPPLALFTSLARDTRLWKKFRDGSLLDRGNLSLRQKEIAIHRTTALCGSEYEWGVHAVSFAPKAGLDDEQLYSTVYGHAGDACWSEADRAIIRACDALQAGSDLDDDIWAGLRSEMSEDAVLELLMVAGFYRTVSYLTNALRLPFEGYAKRFPVRR